MTTTPQSVPNPGSHAAIAQGCLCPVLDNAHGRGYFGAPDRFVYTLGCPLHCPHSVLVEKKNDD